MNSEKTVLVTGFGPFGDHAVNASWEAVKELYEMRSDLHDRYKVNLVIDCIPVVYEHALNRVSQLWKEHKPQIVLHVGVFHRANCLTIEQRAHATGYIRRDIIDKCPSEECEESPVLETAIDVKELCRKMNDKNKGEDSCKVGVSEDAGRYLCEYTYYQSLCQDNKRTLFIHVPDLNVYSTKMVASDLFRDVYGSSSSSASSPLVAFK